MKLHSVIVLSLLTALAGATGARPVQAAPQLTATSHQETRRPSHFTGIPVWEVSWWASLEAKRDRAPLERLEYRGGFARGTVRPASGGWPIGEHHRDEMFGRVRVICDRLADYDETVEMRFRVIDAAGEASDWVTVKFPPPFDDSPPATATPLVDDGTRKKLGSVSYVGDDNATLGEVRKELERLARMQGGDTIGAVRMEGVSVDGRSKFVADVLGPAATPAPVPIATVPARGRGRVLGEIRLRALIN